MAMFRRILHICDKLYYLLTCFQGFRQNKIQINLLSYTEISLVASLDMIFSKKRITKVLNSLHGCAGWYTPLVFSHQGLYDVLANSQYIYYSFFRCVEEKDRAVSTALAGFLMSALGIILYLYKYSGTCVERPFTNRQNKDLNIKWYLNEGQKYCKKFGAFCNTFYLH